MLTARGSSFRFYASAGARIECATVSDDPARRRITSGGLLISRRALETRDRTIACIAAAPNPALGSRENSSPRNARFAVFEPTRAGYVARSGHTACRFFFVFLQRSSRVFSSERSSERGAGTHRRTTPCFPHERNADRGNLGWRYRRRLAVSLPDTRRRRFSAD